MKLILSSAGFKTEKIIKKCEELVGKTRDSINIAVINEAYAVEHDNNLRWVLDDLNGIKNNFDGNLELVNLLALDLETIKERIEKNDVIYVVGGHTDYLMKVFEKTGFSKILPELLKSKVYLGSSAGFMVLGKRLGTEAYKKMYGEEDNFGVDKYMELVEFSIIPHLDSAEFMGRREIFEEAVKDYKGKVYGLRDDSAVVVEGENISTIGSEPTIIN